MLDDEPTTAASGSEAGAPTTSTPAASTPARRRRTPAKKTAAPSAPGDTHDAARPEQPQPEAAGPAPRTPRKRAAKKIAAAPPAHPDGDAGVGDAPAATADKPAKATKTARTTTRRGGGRGRATAAGDSAATTDGSAANTDGSAANTDGSAASKPAAKVAGAGSSEPAHPVAPVIPSVLFQAPVAEVTAPRQRRSTKQAAAAVAETQQVAEAPASGPSNATDTEADADRDPARRRRRGGRGRRREGARDDAANEAGTASDADLAGAEGEAADGAEGHGHDDEYEGDGTSASSRRRRRRRRRGAGGELEEHAPDDPPNTVVRVREPREHDERGGVQGVKGSTRLEAKKQRRREGREQIRRGRRGLVITEAEFLARRESVDRVMAVRQRGDRTQIGVVEDGILVEHFVSTASANRMVGNVFLGRVQNVLPGMEAAFVDIGKGRNAVLYAGEVNFDTSGVEGQPRRIEQALKPGQPVLVQVTKDPIGHKGARLTSQVSLPGRYLVYVPEGSMMGISRKLPDVERSRLKSILKKVMPEGAGVIVRTAAEGASEEELSRDVARLAAQWEDIKKKSESASAPSLLYGEPDLTIRVIRDVFNEDFNSLVVQAESEWDTVEAYVGHVAPDLVSRLSRWTSEEDIFTHYRVEEQIAKALDRKVWLPSGGYLIIDRTEAMIVIDVNTGRFIGKGGNLEETVTKNNLEAAEEIVRQLRLRDIGGIIVIDFIDMVLESNRELVLRRLVECLGRDRTKHQVAEVTSLGLVQMTRKRVGNGLLEAFSEVCETCNGRGVLVHTDPVEQRAPRAAQPPKPGPATVAKASNSRGGRGKRAASVADASAADVPNSGVPDGAVPAHVGGDHGGADGVGADHVGGAGIAAAEPSTDGAVDGAVAGSVEGAVAGSVEGGASSVAESDGSPSDAAAGSGATTSSGSRTRRGGRRRGGSKTAAAPAESVSTPG